DRLGVNLADGSRGRLRRIGRAHHLAIFRNGVLAFQHLHDDRRRNHELNEFAEEWPLTMHAVELFRLFARNVHALLRDDAQAGLLDDRVDRTRQITRGGIGLEDRKRTLDGHRYGPLPWFLGKNAAAAYTGRLFALQDRPCPRKSPRPIAGCRRISYAFTAKREAADEIALPDVCGLQRLVQRTALRRGGRDFRRRLSC